MNWKPLTTSRRRVVTSGSIFQSPNKNCNAFSSFFVLSVPIQTTNFGNYEGHVNHSCVCILHLIGRIYGIGERVGHGPWLLGSCLRDSCANHSSPEGQVKVDPLTNMIMSWFMRFQVGTPRALSILHPLDAHAPFPLTV